MPPLIGQTGETYRGTLNAVGLSPAALFARECIQNAADSALLARQQEIAAPNSSLRVEFHFKTLKGAQKKEFLRALKAEQLAERRDLLELEDGCFLYDTQDSKPLTILVVNDYQTTGLFGNPLTEGLKSHLAKLLFALGDRSKTREMQDAGGSYGFGKGALSKVSRSYCVIAYSRFDERKDGSVHTRLMGCGYYPNHEISGTEYMGLAYFGRVHPDDNNDLGGALENDDAHRLAESLCIQSRSEGETGTSLLIPDPLIGPEELAREIENWWFPALIFSDYEVSVFADGQRVPITPGNRNRRPDLYPFVKAYRLAIGTDQAVGTSEKRYDFEQIDQKKTGSLGMVLIDQGDPSKVNEEDGSNQTRVALVRGNKMVIKYMFVTDNSPVAAGVYVASNEINELLKIAEPPAHNEWDENANKLRKKFGESGPQIVRGVQKRIQTNANHFRRNAIPRKKPSDNHLKVFDVVLSKLFRNRSQGPAVPPVTVKSKFSMQFLAGPELNIGDESDTIFFDAKMKIELMGDVSETVFFAFDPKCQISEDEGAGEDLYVEITVDEGELIKTDSGVYRGSLSPGQRLLLSVLSEQYSSKWTVNFVPTLIEENV